jgi:Xaa-Pro dipeptidase
MQKGGQGAVSEFCPYTYKGYPTGLKYPWTYPMPSERERDRRWGAIRRSMQKHDFDCLIVGGPWGYMPILPWAHHISYISNFVPYSNSATYVVFPLEGEPQLGVDTMVGPQFLHCAVETSWIKEIVGGLYHAQDIVRKIRQLGLDKGRFGVVGFGLGLAPAHRLEEVFPASLYDSLRDTFPAATFEDATAAWTAALNEVSRTSEEELMLLKRACEIHDFSYQAVAKALKPGVKECELWATAEQAIVENGGWYPHFMLATSGPSPVFPRAPASHNAIVSGDVVIFEINVTYGGVSPQICYALSLGRPKREVEEMFEFCEDLYHFCLVELERKRTFMDVELALAQRIHETGYEPMTPQIHIYNMVGNMPMDSPPEPGDYFTVHPNVCNIEYTRGAKFGDTVHIAKDGRVERLHTTPAKLNIIQIS